MKKSILILALISCFWSLSKISYAQSPNWQWAKSAGGIHNNEAYSVALAASGNTYVLGIFESSAIIFDSTILTNSGGGDIFLVKYAPDGNVLWAKSAGGTGYDEVYSVAVDDSENIYIAGAFTGPTITFGSYTLTNNGWANIFFAKYDTNGDVLWAKSASGTGYDEAYSVAVDESEYIYIAGAFTSPTMTFGSDTLKNAGEHDAFLAKYDFDGNVIWAKSACGAYNDGAYSVAVDASGNSYLAGYFSSPTIAFGSDTLTNTYEGLYDLFLAKYDVNGIVLWEKTANGICEDYAKSVTVDASGNTYITGYFSSPSITFGSFTLTNHGWANIFFAKYDTNGDVLWAKSAGGTSDDESYSVAVDALGNSYIAGWFSSSIISFGSYSLTNEGGSDMFIAKYDVNGNVLWAKSAGGTSDDEAYSVSVDASGNTCIAGWYESSGIPFGSDTLTNANSDDIVDMFLAKLESGTSEINELTNSFNISVSPNPAKDKITIETSRDTKESNLVIINLEGQQLMSRPFTDPKMQIDISNLTSGVYFVRLTGLKTVEIGKFIKQ